MRRYSRFERFLSGWLPATLLLFLACFLWLVMGRAWGVGGALGVIALLILLWDFKRSMKEHNVKKDL